MSDAPDRFIENIQSRRNIQRLVRQASMMDTQRDSDGSIKMTYWF